MGSMTTSRIVMPRGRVSMNVTTLATSLASSRLPDSLGSFSFSGGQSASSALMTGPGIRICPICLAEDERAYLRLF